MEEKTFRRLLIVLLLLGIALTGWHLAYLVKAYQHCSIIYFIGSEIW